jgi:glutaredoxin 3
VKDNMAKITEPTEIFVPQYQVLQTLLEKHERAHWIPQEADLNADVTQWKNGSITPPMKEFIKMVLRLFTQSDTNVEAGYVEKLIPVFRQADARMMLLSFASRETTHILAYKRLNDTLGYDSEAFMREFLDYEEMAEKHYFMMDSANLDSQRGRAEYLAKQTLMEGVSLFASFAMLLNFQRLGLLPGMVSINEWSLKDEDVHADGLSQIFKIYVAEHPRIVNDEFKKTIYETARTVIKLEDAFIDLCYDIWEPETLTRKELKDYIRYVCDFRMQQLGFKPQFNISDNPIPWIESFMGSVMKNFFEVTVTDYSKNNLTGTWTYPEDK